jgi:hypothetical protein
MHHRVDLALRDRSSASRHGCQRTPPTGTMPARNGHKSRDWAQIWVPPQNLRLPDLFFGIHPPIVIGHKPIFVPKPPDMGGNRPLSSISGQIAYPKKTLYWSQKRDLLTPAPRKSHPGGRGFESP